ncbi:MAE_28990/MAE_18760 family HEPN-like nuclease [Mesorhizobium kowhaii]|uniref:MAE_28990/MAE_18760 family HEPN-like nuclease n=1 Tax=Mesorhizobium kowhaii TaxID=1300272 RepID=UPI0035E4E841
MSKPYSEQDLSDLFDEDLIWRRRELSDMKAVVKAADTAAKPVMLGAIITMIYAHWEGYVRLCANRYFEYLSIRKQPYTALERQIYVNAFLSRLDALHRSRASVEARCKIVNDILDGTDGTFRYVNPSLIDTKSNLNTDVIKEICLICALDQSYFESNRIFLDQIVLRRRNAIAHGQQEFIKEDEIDGLVSDILSLMQHFRTLLENKVYLKEYAA